jgi:hypothetical protein
LPLPLQVGPAAQLAIAVQAGQESTGPSTR